MFRLVTTQWEFTQSVRGCFVSSSDVWAQSTCGWQRQSLRQRTKYWQQWARDQVWDRTRRKYWQRTELRCVRPQRAPIPRPKMLFALALLITAHLNYWHLWRHWLAFIFDLSSSNFMSSYAVRKFLQLSMCWNDRWISICLFHGRRWAQAWSSHRACKGCIRVCHYELLITSPLHKSTASTTLSLFSKSQ